MDINLNSAAALGSFNQSQLQESSQALLAGLSHAKTHPQALKNQKLQDMEDKKLREQTDQFESLLLKIMLEMAIKNDDGLYPKQPGSDIYHSMFIDQLSQDLAGSFGYSELLFNFLKEQQNQGRIQKPTPKAYADSAKSLNPQGAGNLAAGNLAETPKADIPKFDIPTFDIQG